MCLIVFAYDVHRNNRLVMAANRDEFYARPTAKARFWDDFPEVLAGRDLEKMGTWMGVTKTGRFAAVTNYRDPGGERPDAKSRGALVADFLKGSDSALAYMKQVEKNAQQYNGFNLIAGDAESLYYFSNRANEIQELKQGIYGMSNALLDTPWPKVEHSKQRLNKCLQADAIDRDCLLDLLADSEQAEDEALPDTGIGIEHERLLSSAFIKSPDYGTRASTLLLISRDGQVRFQERSFSPEQKDSKYQFFQQ